MAREDYKRELEMAHQLRELRNLQERTQMDGRLTEQDRGTLRNEIDRTWYLMATGNGRKNGHRTL